MGLQLITQVNYFNNIFKILINILIDKNMNFLLLKWETKKNTFTDKNGAPLQNVWKPLAYWNILDSFQILAISFTSDEEGQTGP
jgi:hypothetical protein